MPPITSKYPGEIPEFSGEYRFLSNFYACQVSIRGRLAPTVEHAFQAAKTKNPDWFRRIIDAPTAGVARQLGNNHDLGLRDDWEQVKVPIMYFLLMQKFEPDSALAAKLSLTVKSHLVEGNHWHDNFWGVCTCPKCPGVGRNMLGTLLTTIRSILNNEVPLFDA